MPDPQGSCPRFHVSALKLPLVVAATLVLALLIYRHTPGLDGPWYAHYGWHRARATTHIPLMLLAAAPMAAALVLVERRPLNRPLLPLLLVMVSVIGFILVNVTHLGPEPSWWPMIELISNPMALSYFADATRFHGTFWDSLAHWPELMPQMYLHTQTKPPGPVLFFSIFIQTFGATHRAAMISGISLAVLTSFAVPAVYCLARVLRAGTFEAFAAATCLALFPSVILFFPSLDAAYIIASAALMGLWVMAITRQSWKAAMAFGAVLALITFFIYNILVIGFVLAAWAWLMTRTRRVAVITYCAVVALGTYGALYLLLWLIKGFDPIATFAAALQNQARLLQGFDRPYPQTILFDLTDFALGAGWIALLLTAFYLTTPARRQLVVAALLQLALVAITGLLPGETARVWAFMSPLIALPAGFELARQSRTHRFICYACMFVLLAILSANVNPPHGTNAPLVGQTRPSQQ